MNAVRQPDLIYAPAKREAIGWLIMLAGPSDSGKTFSALRLATGIAGPGGRIGLVDTEHGRATFYADFFDFDYARLEEPFLPSKFEHAAMSSQRAGHDVWICDNFSAEHWGPGGVLDWHEQELQRMAGDDWAKREKANFTAWIAPKGEHTRMLQRLWQMNSHIILCCAAKEKIDLNNKDPRTGKMKPKSLGFVPVCGEDIPYAMTASFLLDPKRQGCPTPIKLMEQHAHIFPTDRPIDEETGAAIRAWSRREPIPPRSASPPPPPRSRATQDHLRQQQAAPGSREAIRQEQAEQFAPPAADTAKVDAAEAKAVAMAEDLETAFLGTDDGPAHFALVDDPIRQKQIAWLKKHRSTDLWPKVDAAIQASYTRNGLDGTAISPPAEPPAESPDEPAC
jgi:hypothetical protein